MADLACWPPRHLSGQSARLARASLAIGLLIMFFCRWAAVQPGWVVGPVTINLPGSPTVVYPLRIPLPDQCTAAKQLFIDDREER
jgi:hypothetical protein